MRYFTADTHFFHQNIISYCGRPFKDAKQMNQVIKDNWNEIVKDDDTIYVLGDLSTWYNIDVSQVAHFVRKLNGRKILILGNHDKFEPFDYVDMGFESVHTHLYLEDLKVHLTHDPANSVLIPHSKWLCGHVHGLFKSVGNVLNVGVDVWDFAPVCEQAIKEWAAGLWNWDDEDKRKGWEKCRAFDNPAETNRMGVK